MSYQWEYRPWRSASKQLLKADDLLDATMASTYKPPKAPKSKAPKPPLGQTPASSAFTAGTWKMSLIRYADQAYVAARIVGLAGHELHLPSLYFVGQTIELYLKALLYDRLDDLWDRAFGAKPANAPPLPGPETKTHDLALLAQDVGSDHPEFLDPEFLLLCERLSAFQEAGRYPDHGVQRWAPSLSCLTFLDSFVTHCREIMNVVPSQTDAALLNSLFTIISPSRPAQAAQQLGVLELLAEENDHLRDLTGFSEERIADIVEDAKYWVLQDIQASGIGARRRRTRRVVASPTQP